MQTTMIRASMTAYSTAVGPSSRFRNSTANCVNLRMSLIPSKEPEIENQVVSKRGDALRTRDVDGAADTRESAVGIGAERRDRRDAHHDDQGQHDRVLDGRRTVFTLQKLDCELSQLTHEPNPFPF